MRFRIDLKIFIFLILFFITKQVYTYATIMIFAIIHEFGHLIVGLLLGMKPDKLEIMPYGASIAFKINPKDYNIKIKKGNRLEFKKILVAIAGPVTNVILIIIGLNMDLNIFHKLIIIYSNLLLIIFNLLPIYPLDGGRVLKGLLHILFGKKKAEKYINIISFLTVILITIIASITIFYLKNISIFIIIVFLWCMVIREDIIYNRKIKIYNLQKDIEIKRNK